MDKCGSVGVVLCEEAQCEGGHWVVAPRPVQLHKQLTTLLGNESKKISAQNCSHIIQESRLLFAILKHAGVRVTLPVKCWSSRCKEDKQKIDRREMLDTHRR